ncbi:unnamed protein product [Lactuca saligna]|uniref:Amino acid transporter transmembrane domain-containing protein n=1 Tax=Lactuca saligna TaxID=75948 RepID=A0AA35Z873_LACSI|nr:unnamed protein product [Lactuca saligna]
MMGSNPLFPKWILLMTNSFTVLQVASCTLVYLQPLNVVFERKFADLGKGQLSVRNFVPQLISRYLSVIITTTLDAMFPFFGDIMALFGSIWMHTLDFILPMLFYNLMFKPSKLTRGSFLGEYYDWCCITHGQQPEVGEFTREDEMTLIHLSSPRNYQDRCWDHYNPHESNLTSELQGGWRKSQI